MTEETLKRANEIETMRGQLNGIYIDKFTNETIKLSVRNPIGEYFNKELSTKIVEFFEGLDNDYKKELEEL